MHDFRIVGEGEKKNLIFDIVINSTRAGSKKDIDNLVENIKEDIKKEHPQYNCIITVDFDYMG